MGDWRRYGGAFCKRGVPVSEYVLLLGSCVLVLGTAWALVYWALSAP